MSKATDDTPRPLAVAVLTVSDTRTEENDTSGDYLQEALEAEGHRAAARTIVIDDIYQIRAVISAWIADAGIDAVLVTGGTGFSGRDSTPEAVQPLFDKDIDGFGEIFRRGPRSAYVQNYRGVSRTTSPANQSHRNKLCPWLAEFRGESGIFWTNKLIARIPVTGLVP